MKIIDDFAAEVHGCITRLTAQKERPALIINELNSLKIKFEKKASDLGFPKDILLTDIHSVLVRMLSEFTDKVIQYESPFTDLEKSVIEVFRAENKKAVTRCLPKKAVEFALEESNTVKIDAAVISLYHRGILADGEMNLSLCLTSAGRGLL